MKSGASYGINKKKAAWLSGNSINWLLESQLAEIVFISFMKCFYFCIKAQRIVEYF